MTIEEQLSEANKIIIRLIADHATLGADRLRLDWIEEHRRTLHALDDGGWQCGRCRMGTVTTAREAIDESMKATP